MYNQMFLSDPLILERSRDFVKHVKKFLKSKLGVGVLNIEQATEDKEEKNHNLGRLFTPSGVLEDTFKEDANLKSDINLLGDSNYQLNVVDVGGSSVLKCTKEETTVFQISGISSSFNVSSVSISGESVLLNVEIVDGLELTENNNELAFCIVGASGISENAENYTNNTSVTFKGSSTADRIYIYENNVRVFCGNGDDTLCSYGGNYYIYGEEGNDEIYCYDANGIIMIDGGGGDNGIYVGSKESEGDDDSDEIISELLGKSGTLGESLSDERVNSLYSQEYHESHLKNKASASGINIVSSKV